MSSTFHDKQGNYITIAEYIALIELGLEYKRVGLTEVGDAEVITSWLGLDHNWGSGAPLIFESMIFGGHRSQDLDRYSTLAAAEAGHRSMVDELARDQEQASENFLKESS